MQAKVAEVSREGSSVVKGGDGLPTDELSGVARSSATARE